MTTAVGEPWALVLASALLAHLLADFPLQRGEVAGRNGASRRALGDTSASCSSCSP